MTKSSTEVTAYQNTDDVDQQKHCQWVKNHPRVLQKWKSCNDSTYTQSMKV